MIIPFSKEFHAGLEGYISVVGNEVWISAVKSKEIGKGEFSNLVKELKLRYHTIKIPTPSGMMVERAKHLGFILEEEWFGEPFNEMGRVMVWKRREVDK